MLPIGTGSMLKRSNTSTHNKVGVSTHNKVGVYGLIILITFSLLWVFVYCFCDLYLLIPPCISHEP